MTAPIIFFLAVAVFIVLAAKRFSFLPKIKLPHIKFGAGMSSVGKTFSGFSPKFKKPKMQERVDSGRAMETHDFWQEESIESKPDVPSYYDEGEKLFHEGKYKEAEKLFIKAASLRPNDSKIYARLGLLYLQQKNYTDAIESIKLAVKYDKNNPSRHFNLALAYQGAKDRQRAISAAREAVSIDPVTPKYREFLEQLLSK